MCKESQMKYETSLKQRYKDMNLKDASLYKKLHGIAALPSTRHLDLICMMHMEPKTKEIRVRMAAHAAASNFIQGMDRGSILTYVMYNIAYLFARMVG